MEWDPSIFIPVFPLPLTLDNTRQVLEQMPGLLLLKAKPLGQGWILLPEKPLGQENQPPAPAPAPAPRLVISSSFSLSLFFF